MKVAVDSSMLVGLLNANDLWHTRAVALKGSLIRSGSDLIFFDCVVAEAVSTIVRRLQEKNRSGDISSLLDTLNADIPRENITWILPDVRRLYAQVLDLVRMTQGALNFNDALIAVACQERAIPQIASFDEDFDQVIWLTRIATP
jgi:predicted nucleic acid-binding protein